MPAYFWNLSNNIYIEFENDVQVHPKEGMGDTLSATDKYELEE